MYQQTIHIFLRTGGTHCPIGNPIFHGRALTGTVGGGEGSMEAAHEAVRRLSTRKKPPRNPFPRRVRRGTTFPEPPCYIELTEHSPIQWNVDILQDAARCCTAHWESMRVVISGTQS